MEINPRKVFERMFGQGNNAEDRMAHRQQDASILDLMALSFQAGVTRVSTFMAAREISNRTYLQVGVPDGHHAISHHQNRAEKM